MTQISQKLSTKRLDAQNSDLAPFLGDLIQSEKLSKIKPSLSKTSSDTSTLINIQNILNLKKVRTKNIERNHKRQGELKYVYTTKK